MRIRIINACGGSPDGICPLVYPGAIHTRLHHSLGAYHLMAMAIGELKNKGFVITPEEEVAAKAAILLHDAGHAPFSHALERILILGFNMKTISLLIMKELNEEFNGQLGPGDSDLHQSIP